MATSPIESGRTPDMTSASLTGPERAMERDVQDVDFALRFDADRIPNSLFAMTVGTTERLVAAAQYFIEQTLAARSLNRVLAEALGDATLTGEEVAARLASLVTEHEYALVSGEVLRQYLLLQKADEEQIDSLVENAKLLVTEVEAISIMGDKAPWDESMDALSADLKQFEFEKSRGEHQDPEDGLPPVDLSRPFAESVAEEAHLVHGWKAEEKALTNPSTQSQSPQ